MCCTLPLVYSCICTVSCTEDPTIIYCYILAIRAQDFTKSITNKVFEFGQFQGVAASFETEVRGEGWDSGMVTAKNAEVQQSSVSLSDFIDETQAKLQAVADKHKVIIA